MEGLISYTSKVGGFKTVDVPISVKVIKLKYFKFCKYWRVLDMKRTTAEPFFSIYRGGANQNKYQTFW